MKKHRTLALPFAAMLLATVASAQTPTTPYGAPISLDQAKKVVAAAEAEARKNNWNVVIAVLDSGGHLVLLQRLDNTQFASVEVAQQKAYSAVAFRRPTKVFQDGVAAGGEGLRILKLAGATPVEGGLPLIVDGKLVGAIGVSGVTSQQDNQIAKAGADVLK
jgi:glc operon protein GlcG